MREKKISIMYIKTALIVVESSFRIHVPVVRALYVYAPGCVDYDENCSYCGVDRAGKTGCANCRAGYALIKEEDRCQGE